jgi:ankyrin repeat protein
MDANQALIEAAKTGNLAEAEKALAMRANTKFDSSKAFQIAIINRHNEIAKRLFEKDALYLGLAFNALWLAVDNKNTEMFLLLAEHLFVNSAIFKSHGDFYIIRAAKNDSIEIFQWLAEHGVDYRGAYNSFLGIATEHNSHQIVAYLNSRGVTTFAKNA